MLPLFRSEAVAHAARGLDGRVLLPSRLPVSLLALLLGAVLAGGIAFASTATYARTEAASGRLVPTGGGLAAELLVPSSAVGLIRPGQAVELVYEAFPVRRFGAHTGVVTAVSATVLAPTEVAVPRLPLAGPVFRVDVRLAAQEVHARGTRVQLRAGMLLSAAIAVDRRPLLKRVFDSGRRRPWRRS